MPLLDYSISISISKTGTQGPPQEIHRGESIDLVAIPTIAHPTGTTPTESIAWFIHTGEQIGNSLSTTYTPVTDGWFSAEVVITYEDISAGYARTVSQDVSFFVELSSYVTLDFNLTYRTTPRVGRYSNMDMHRFMSIFPVWSSAYSNFFSNTSKLFSPMVESISQTMDEFDAYAEANKSVVPEIAFGYRGNQYEIITYEIPELIRTEYGHAYHMGPHFRRSIESSQIMAYSTRAGGACDRRELVGTDSGKVAPLRLPSLLYVVASSASVRDPETVVLHGINEHGDEISEELVISSSVPHETMNKFKILLRSESSAPGAIRVYTYLNLSELHSSVNGLGVQKRICDISGGYFEPEYVVDENRVSVLNSYSIGRSDVYRFDAENKIEALFVNGLSDVVYLSDNKVYSAKLMLDFYNIEQPDSSTNINSFIYVSDENTPVGEDVEVTIKCDNIRDEFKGHYVKVCLENRSGRYYLGDNLTLTQDKNTWLNLMNAGNLISFSVPITNSDPYRFILEVDGRAGQFSAMTYTNKLGEVEVLSDISGIFIYNKELWAETTSSEFLIIDPVRLGFTSGTNRIYLPYKFSTVEPVYKNNQA